MISFQFQGNNVELQNISNPSKAFDILEEHSDIISDVFNTFVKVIGDGDTISDENLILIAAKQVSDRFRFDFADIEAILRGHFGKGSIISYSDHVILQSINGSDPILIGAEDPAFVGHRILINVDDKRDPFDIINRGNHFVAFLNIFDVDAIIKLAEAIHNLHGHRVSNNVCAAIGSYIAVWYDKHAKLAIHAKAILDSAQIDQDFIKQLVIG